MSHPSSISTRGWFFRSPVIKDAIGSDGALAGDHCSPAPQEPHVVSNTALALSSAVTN